MTKTGTKINWKLNQRLNRLPKDQYDLVANTVVRKSACSKETYYRVINGRSTNLYVLQALAQVLRCTLDDVTNPEYVFIDPQIKEENQVISHQLQKIGLTKSR